MCEKICKNCVWMAELKHNFKVGQGYEKSFCCTNLVDWAGKLIIEVSPDSTCEEFFNKIDANGLIRKYK